MMTVGSISGTDNIQGSGFGANMQKDPVSKSIQNQIENKQKELQELASDDKMTPEEKMKKRQEIQQEINILNQELRQHQITQRKEQQQRAASAQMSTPADANQTIKDAKEADSREEKKDINNESRNKAGKAESKDKDGKTEENIKGEKQTKERKVSEDITEQTQKISYIPIDIRL